MLVQVINIIKQVLDSSISRFRSVNTTHRQDCLL